MSQPLISIIVPVYNVEKYIEQCIESIIHQSFRDYELILVNDGSTDKSLDKCRLWEFDERVHIISIENHGVSYARNLGLKNASGKWVMFLDSDDYLIENCLEKLASAISMEAQEISGLYVEEEKENLGKQQYGLIDAKSMMEMSLDPINNNLLPEFYPLKVSTLLFCSGKLFLNQVIKEHGVKFQENLRLSEDLVFHLDYLSHIENVMITNVPVLFYRQNNTSSVTKRFHTGYFDDRARLVEKLKTFSMDSANVHIISTLFLFICKIEKYVTGTEKKHMEQKLSQLLQENRDILVSSKGKKLSKGKWQNVFYKIVTYCFFLNWNWIAFKILKLYTFIARGEI